MMYSESMSSSDMSLSVVETVPGLDPISQQARAQLLDFLRIAETATAAELPRDPHRCPNCGVQVSSEKSPYCGKDCREEAAFVRQLRTGISEKTMLDMERSVSLGQVLWHLLGGGYPLRLSLVPKKSIAQVINRAQSKCEACGSLATTVDHLKTACNRPINLRAVCGECCKDRPFGEPRVTSAKGYAEKQLLLAARVGAPDPLRCCDDADSWDWRAFLAERVAR